MSDTEEFFAFERQADQLLKGLALWRRPLRSVFTSIALTADGAFSGGRFGRLQAVDANKGGTILSRLSYLMTSMRTCTDELGSDVLDALNVLTASDFAEIQSALQYGHLCELVPFVRNGYFQVHRTTSGFRLNHPSAVFAYDEQRDIIASEISLTMLQSRAPFEVPELNRMVEGWPYLRHDDLRHVLGRAYEHYLSGIHEDPYVRLSSYKAAYGFDRDDFLKVRAAMMAFASWCIGMSAAADGMSQRAGSAEPERWRKECLEWAVPVMKKWFLLQIIGELAGTTDDITHRILDHFTESPFERKNPSGDGFLAPLVAVKESYLFSPRTLLHMTVERNLIYVLNRMSRDHFNNMVSQHLEPALLDQAEGIFSSFPKLRTRKNVVWDRGEIDMLVFNEETASVLQLQAKAPIPPQGARMTRQIERNTLDAVQQLKTVEDLNPEQKREVLRNCFGVDAPDVRWASAVLTRSSLGTSRAWSSLGGRGALNLTLLRTALRNIAADGQVDPTLLPAESFRLLGLLIQEASNGWREDSFDLFGTSISFPNLKLDHMPIARFVERSVVEDHR